MVLKNWIFKAGKQIFNEYTLHYDQIKNEAKERGMIDNPISYAIVACSKIDTKNIIFQIGIYELTIPKNKIFTFVPFIRMVSTNSNQTSMTYMYLLDGQEYYLSENAKLLT